MDDLMLRLTDCMAQNRSTLIASERLRQRLVRAITRLERLESVRTVDRVSFRAADFCRAKAEIREIIDHWAQAVDAAADRVDAANDRVL